MAIPKIITDGSYSDYPIASINTTSIKWTKEKEDEYRKNFDNKLAEYMKAIEALSAIPDTPEGKDKLLSKAGVDNNGVKVATPDLVLFNEDGVSIELMTDLIFENIGGQELINIVRSDLVNGQNVIYQPIKNLSSVYFQYNPQNILGLQDIDSNYFKQFPINFNNKVPECWTGPNCAKVYIDSNGDLVINVINLAKDEQVEISIVADGKVLDGTIYEVNP